MIKPRIKICGITSVNDALSAAAAGADALGLVFYQKSARFIDIDQASEIARQIPPFICLVGLFVNASEQTIADVLAKVPLGLLQFHGDEKEQDCTRWHRPYIKAFRVRSDECASTLAERVAPYHSASGYLFDSYNPALRGGTGESFQWQLIPDSLEKPVILAGGLHANNVARAIATVKPYAVDVSSGVERAPGIKDIEKLKAFIQATGR